MLLKYLLFAALLGCARADQISIQDQLYIVAGILGGVCLLLVIAAIFSSVSIINLQTEVKLLKQSGKAAVNAMATELTSQQPPPGPRREPYSAYGGSRPEDNYRRSPPKDSFRMNRPAPPARPPRRDYY